jgi:NhaA family Na+:H+ antiporter
VNVETMQRLTLPVDTEVDHIRGPVDAPVTLVWYGDYECDYCAAAFPVVNEVMDVMGGRMRLVYRHFPQASIHPHAATAAQAAEAAGEQGRYWAMHDLLFIEQDKLADADLTYYALKIPGMELYKFQADIAAERFGPKIRRDLDSAVASGVTGTPTFFTNGVRYKGPISVPDIIEALDATAEQASR